MSLQRCLLNFIRYDPMIYKDQHYFLNILFRRITGILIQYFYVFLTAAYKIIS